MVTTFNGYTVRGVIATVTDDPLCGSGVRIAIEPPPPCPSCGRLPVWSEHSPMLFSRFGGARAPGVDGGWFTLDDYRAALRDVEAFICVMFGDPDGKVPATAMTPLGVEIKVGDILYAVRNALAGQTGTVPERTTP